MLEWIHLFISVEIAQWRIQISSIVRHFRPRVLRKNPHKVFNLAMWEAAYMWPKVLSKVNYGFMTWRLSNGEHKGHLELLFEPPIRSARRSNSPNPRLKQTNKANDTHRYRDSTYEVLCCRAEKLHLSQLMLRPACLVGIKWWLW